jgi:MoxR-like ATPase
MAHVKRMAEAKALRDSARQVHVEDSVLEYASRLTQATRARPEVRYGASVRAALQLVAVARARALLLGRDYVIPADLQALAAPALAHRLCLDPTLEIEDGESRLRQRILSELIERTPAPR